MRSNRSRSWARLTMLASQVEQLEIWLKKLVRNSSTCFPSTIKSKMSKSYIWSISEMQIIRRHTCKLVKIESVSSTQSKVDSNELHSTRCRHAIELSWITPTWTQPYHRHLYLIVDGHKCNSWGANISSFSNQYNPLIIIRKLHYDHIKVVLLI